MMLRPSSLAAAAFLSQGPPASDVLSYVLGAASAIFFVNNYHQMLVSSYRTAAKVEYPVCYASSEEAEKDMAVYKFNCGRSLILFFFLWGNKDVLGHSPLTAFPLLLASPESPRQLPRERSHRPQRPLHRRHQVPCPEREPRRRLGNSACPVRPRLRQEGPQRPHAVCFSPVPAFLRCVSNT